MKSAIKICTISRSDRGLVRTDNEDSVLCLSDKRVYAVADGMGGGDEGALASCMVCRALKKFVVADDFRARMADVCDAVDKANAEIFAYSKEHGYRQMGSTVAVLAMDGPADAHATVGHVGDSRVYRVRGGLAELLTRDHSIGAELAEHVGVSAAAKFAARTNPLAHVLTRAIGTGPHVSLDWRKIDVACGDRFVVCSDGVHDVVDALEIGPLIAGDLSAAADRLENVIRQRGAPDNYSFIIVQAGGDGDGRNRV